MASRSETEYIYGRHAVTEALRHRPDVLTELYLAPDFDGAEILSLATAAQVSVKLLNLKNPPRGISANATHQGVVAGLVPRQLLRAYRDFISETASTPPIALLVLGEVQDPHNVGAVIRSAAAFGLAGVLIPPHQQAPVSGTVIKVSAGMAFRVPLVAIRNVNATLTDLKDRGFWVYGLAGEGTASTSTETYPKPSVFVLGNEAEGLREKTRAACDELLAIPIHPRCESLNAAAATAIALASWSRAHPEALADNSVDM